MEDERQGDEAQGRPHNEVVSLGTLGFLCFTSHLPGMVFLIFTGSIYHVSVLVSSAKIKKREKFSGGARDPAGKQTGCRGLAP